MHRNYLFIAIILVASLAAYLVLMYSFNQLQAETLIKNQVVGSNESVIIPKELKSGQKVYLVIHYPVFGIPLNANVKDPSGEVVMDINSTSYDRELYATFEPALNGKYTLAITNHGMQDTPVHVIFSNAENLSAKNPYE
jgi:hypothetical protein